MSFGEVRRRLSEAERQQRIAEPPRKRRSVQIQPPPPCFAASFTASTDFTGSRWFGLLPSRLGGAKSQCISASAESQRHREQHGDVCRVDRGRSHSCSGEAIARAGFILGFVGPFVGFCSPYFTLLQDVAQDRRKWRLDWEAPMKKGLTSL